MRQPLFYKSFTLAEVLITIGVIGIVATIVVPTLMSNINDKVFYERARNIRYKFTQATDKMKSLALIGPYESTDDFVNELEKHFKIMKRCNSSNIEKCWPTATVTIDNEGKVWEISKTTSGKQLKMSNDETHEYGSTVGIVTADGASMIISYNQKCESLEQYKTYTWDRELLTNSTANCAAIVFDVNGAKGPNKLGKDVVNFNSNGLGTSCAIMGAGDVCFGAPFVPTPVSCNTVKAEYGIKYCFFNNNNDYWVGAIVQCGGKDKMPSLEQLAAFDSLLMTNGKTDASKLAKFGLPTNLNFMIWSSKETDVGGTVGVPYYGLLTDVRYWYAPNEPYNRYNTQNYRNSAGPTYAVCLVED